MKRKRELELVMNEVKKLNKECGYADLENAVMRGLINIHCERYDERQKAKQKRQR